MRFRSVISLSMLLLAAGILAAAAWATQVVIERFALATLGEDLQRSQRVFEELQGYRLALLRAQADVVANEPRLRAVVATEEVTRETVLGVAHELRRAAGCDLFLVISPQGALIADVLEPDASGDDLSQNPIVSSALSGGTGTGVWADAKNVYQVQARRVDFGATPVGVLVLGYRLDERVAQLVQTQTGSAVAITLDGRVLASSTLDGGRAADPGALAAALGPLVPGAPVELALDGTGYMALTAPFPGYAGALRLQYAVMRSLDAAFAPGRALLRVLLGVFGAAVLVAIAFAWLVARRLSRPIDALVAFTARVAGGALDTRVEAAGPTELRTLGQAMNHMVGEISQSRRQLVDKERLEKEMQIATQLQTALLPKKTELPGSELAARMVTATEVGGDYYDVIPVGDGGWVCIGDVAGHGLPAGVVMMMIQNAVAALVRGDPSATPKHVVRVLNQVLYENVRGRLGRDEHATLSLIRYHADGRIIYAGAHEDLLLWRARTGRCERLSTPGAWVGGMKDVERHTAETEHRLEPGDRLVLFTDGVIEMKDGAGQEFGIDRLCSEIERQAASSCAALCEHLVEQVKQFGPVIDDDVTVVALRYAP